MTDVVNNKVHHRYELAVDGHLAATYYKISGDVITFVHTEVPPELGGKGIGSKLVKGALDQVRSEGLKSRGWFGRIERVQGDSLSRIFDG